MSAAMFSAGSRREWAACRAILMHPVRKLRARGNLWLHWMLIGLVLLAGVSAMMVKDKGALVLALGAGIPLAMLLLMWWVMFFGSILAQCSAAAMHLTPRMRERAMRVTVAAWAGVTLLMTLCVGVPTGYPGQVAVLTGLALLETTVMASRWRLGIFIFVFWLGSYTGFAIPAWFTAILASNVAVAIGALVVVLDGRVALRRMFGTPNRVRAWSASNETVPPLISSLAQLLKTRPRDFARRQPLFTRVLGGPAFAATVTLLAVPAVASVAIRAVVALQDTGAAHERLLMTRCMALIGVLVLQGMMTHTVAARMLHHRAEQSLVRLSPGAPPAATLNRVLARYLLENFALMWIGCSVGAIAALLVLGANGGEALRAMAACTFSLALAGLPLRDYARKKVSRILSTLLYWLCAAAALVASGAALYGRYAGQAWASMALASVLLAALFTWWRWRAMVAAAPAFPAGRLN